MMARIRDWLEERWQQCWPSVRQELSLAGRNVLRQRRRSAVGILAIAASVVSLMLAAGFFEWNQSALREGMTRGRLGHIQAVKSGYFEGGTADPFAYQLPESGELRDLLQAFPGVTTVAPRLSLTGLISIGESTFSFLGEGVDPSREQELSSAVEIKEGGRNLMSRDAKEVIVGRGLASTLGVQVGQKVVLVAKTKSGGINALEVEVVGFFSTVTKAYDDLAIRLPLTVAQELIRSQGVHQWLVLLQDEAQTDAVLRRMRDKVTLPGIELKAWYDTPGADFYNKTVALFSQQVFIIRLMIATIVVLSISNTLMNNVRERIPEIGTAMALGDTSTVVLRRFLAEGAVLGFFGGIVGVVIGVAAAAAISRVGIPMPPPPGAAVGYVAGIRVTIGIVFDALALAVVTAFLAGLYPAWRASRLNICDALRQAR